MLQFMKIFNWQKKMIESYTIPFLICTLVSLIHSVFGITKSFFLIYGWIIHSFISWNHSLFGYMELLVYWHYKTVHSLISWNYSLVHCITELFVIWFMDLFWPVNSWHINSFQFFFFFNFLPIKKNLTHFFLKFKI